MRLCILGNSHVGALRTAHYATHTLFPNKVDFHAMPGGWLEIKDGVVVTASTDELHSTVGVELDPTLFSAILVSAVGHWAVRNENTQHVLRKMGLSSWGGSVPSVSVAVFRRSVRQLLSNWVYVKLSLDLASVYKGTLVFQPWPMPVRRALSDPAWEINKIYGKHAPEAIAYYYQTQYEVMHELLAGKGRLLPYPDGHWLEAGFTPDEFGTPDPWHMNGEYGALVLKQFAESLPI